MSKTLTFYRVEAVRETLPEIVDLDNTTLEDAYSNAEAAEPWVRQIGQKCRLRYRAVDLFGACEKIFGKRPGSIRYGLSGEKICMDREGNRIGILTREMLEPYASVAEERVYVYRQEEISSTDAYCVPEVEDGILSFEDLLGLARRCLEQEEEWGDAAVRGVAAIMKAAFCAQDGAAVLCRTD